MPSGNLEVKWHPCLPAPPVEDEVCGGDLDGALARHPAPLVDHGHDEGVGVAVVDVDPLKGAVEGEADAVAVAHRGGGHDSSHSSRRHIGERRLLQRKKGIRSTLL